METVGIVILTVLGIGAGVLVLGLIFKTVNDMYSH